MAFNHIKKDPRRENGTFKMCGGDLNPIEGSTVCVCEFCGTKQTVPSLDNEKMQNFLKIVFEKTRENKRKKEKKREHTQRY